LHHHGGERARQLRQSLPGEKGAERDVAALRRLLGYALRLGEDIDALQLAVERDELGARGIDRRDVGFPQKRKGRFRPAMDELRAELDRDR
jgi:hypothetical protein